MIDVGRVGLVDAGRSEQNVSIDERDMTRRQREMSEFASLAIHDTRYGYSEFDSSYAALRDHKHNFQTALMIESHAESSYKHLDSIKIESYPMRGVDREAIGRREAFRGFLSTIESRRKAGCR